VLLVNNRDADVRERRFALNQAVLENGWHVCAATAPALTIDLICVKYESFKELIMRIKTFIIISLLSFIVISCFDFIGREIKQELLSPSGSHKLIWQSVNGGTATEHINKVFVLKHDSKLKNNFTPIFTTTEGNIIDISWINDMDILIRVKSETLIRYQVVKFYGTNIIVEVEDGSTDTL
jgi:hypothetical protein